MEHKSDRNTNYNWLARYSHQKGLIKELEDHTNYSIVEIGQNSKKSPGDLRRLAVTQTPVEDHQLTLVYAQTKIRPGELNTQNSLVFCDTNRSPSPG